MSSYQSITNYNPLKTHTFLKPLDDDYAWQKTPQNEKWAFFCKYAPERGERGKIEKYR